MQGKGRTRHRAHTKVPASAVDSADPSARDVCVRAAGNDDSGRVLTKMAAGRYGSAREILANLAAERAYCTAPASAPGRAELRSYPLHMTLTAGTRLGSYEIGAPLGRGGVGEVYRAWDPRLEREVALKILRERAEIDPARVWRFVAEARAASALNHPNILTVFDAAVDGATPYIVSELIEGDSLRGEVRRGPVSL